ncbi:MAG: histidine triad nucleotide-binding protein [Abditibacteriota bacterium]|nr:histidine triad nucleotide-binding protein [Abditibacteriota bacterium]
MEDCIFCKIANKEMGSLLYEDDKVAAFNDINAQAPIHILIVPKKHISTLNELREEDEALVGHMAFVASNLAKEKGIDKNGYRLIMNCNHDAGQTVFHIHMHLLGGKPLKAGLA